MNTTTKRNTKWNTRNTTRVTAMALGMTLLVALAGAQEVAGGGANKDDHAYKGAMQQMARLKEAAVIPVKGDENWDAMLGFGKESEMAEMMTLMMVGGSGMEHMKMAAMRPGMKMDKSKMKGMAVRDKKSDMKQEATLPASVKMPNMAAQNNPKPDSMPQKSETPAPVIVAPVPAPAPAKTTTVDDKAPVKAVEAANPSETAKPAPDKTLPAQTAGYQVMVNTSAKTLKTGKNMLDVTVLDSGGKLVTGAKVTAVVEMTSMDMGVTRPKAKEDKAGHYLSEITFSMKGPWRVTVTITPPKQKPFTKALDFNVPK